MAAAPVSTRPLLPALPGGGIGRVGRAVVPLALGVAGLGGAVLLAPLATFALVVPAPPLVLGFLVPPVALALPLPLAMAAEWRPGTGPGGIG